MTISEQIAALSQKIHSYAAEAKRRDEFPARTYAALETRLAAFNEKMDAHGRHLGAVEKKLEAQVQQLGALETKVDAQALKLLAVEKKLDALAAKADAQGGKLQAHASALNTIRDAMRRP